MIDKEKIIEAIFERAEGLYFCCTYNDTIALERYGLPFKWYASDKECMTHYSHIRLLKHEGVVTLFGYTLRVDILPFSSLQTIIEEEIDKEEKETINKHSQNSNTKNDEIDKNNDKIKELKTRIKELKKEK